MNRRSIGLGALALLAIIPFTGCGTTLGRTATDQLLTSDAVDRTVAQIDFRALSGKKVFLDAKHLRTVSGKTGTFTHEDYIISSLRQQMMAARCLLQDKEAEADYIVEVRVGALGTDSHSLKYGIPASNALNLAAAAVPALPPLPAIPEISVAKKDDSTAAAKICMFAYNRKTKEPVWQSGVTKGWSTAKSTWILGAGPFQRGTIYEGTRLAGSKLELPKLHRHDEPEQKVPISYYKACTFEEPSEEEPKAEPKVAKADNPPPKKTPNVAAKGAKAKVVPVSTQSVKKKPSDKQAAVQKVEDRPKVASQAIGKSRPAA